MKIKALKPHAVAIDDRKKTLLKIARSGGKRPSQIEPDLAMRQLGIALTNYTVGNAYDPTFTKQIKELRPEWLGRVWPTRQRRINEKRLIALAMNDAPRPRSGTQLGNALSAYKSVKNPKRFHPELIGQLIKIRPTWFVTPTDVVKERKIHLLTMANLGEPKPVSWSENENERDWARYLSYYKSTDPHFRALLEAIPTDWFIPSRMKKQILLLEMARRGFPKPEENTPLGNILKRDRRDSGSSILHNKIIETRPDWFPRGGHYNTVRV